MIDLWDKKGDYLLSSHHDHLKIGFSEGEIPNDDSSFSSPSESNGVRHGIRHTKIEESSSNEIAAVMKSVIDLCNDNTNGGNRGKGVAASIKSEGIVTIEDLPMNDLYEMIEQRKLHIFF